MRTFGRLSFLTLIGISILILLSGIAAAQNDINSLTAKDKELMQKLDNLRKEMQSLRDAGDLDGFNAKNKEYAKVSNELKEIRTQVAKINEADKKVVEVKKLYHDGYNSFKLDRYVQALASFDQSITKGKALNNPSLDPIICKSYYFKGLIYKKQKKYNDAVMSYQNAIEAYPSYGNVRTALGRLYDQTRQYDKARTTFTDALQADPTVADDAYYGLGKICLEVDKDYKKALDYFKKSFAANNKKFLSAHNIGVSLFNMGRKQEAIQYFQQAVNIRPKYYLSLYFLAQSYYDIGRLDDAEAYADDCLKLRRNYGGALLIKGYIANKHGNKKEALKYYNQAKKDRLWRQLADHAIEMIAYEEKMGKGSK